MDLVQVAVTSPVSLAAMFLLTKLMGNKQISQMNLFDYVIGITVGSITAVMAGAGHAGKFAGYHGDVCGGGGVHFPMGQQIPGGSTDHYGKAADFDGRRGHLPGESEKGQDGSGGLSHVLPHRGIF